ncbi:protein serine/threonine phosphatase 2C [Atractiella rhizophila]|nr:protein serine/threonine phosphatase 2C [Atractiella rhizophila]
MEDAHAFVYDFGGVRGQGYFAVFDGHAGKHAAEWCGAHFHEYLLKELRKDPKSPIPDLLNTTFHVVDAELSRQAHEDNTHSGCTAVTAFLRLEDKEGRPVGDGGGVSEQVLDSSAGEEQKKRKSTEAAELPAAKRTLYTANVGDARAVLCRNGKAVRLTYDHKGSDAQEAKRIMDAGGFVMNNRVNGVLAVTRSLGDSSMKEFVVGSPYTTETTLTEADEFLIIACDGLWDVCEDQKAVDLIRDKAKDPQGASKILLDHALTNFSTDNLSVLVVTF